MGGLRLQSHEPARHQEGMVVPHAERHLVHRGARRSGRRSPAHVSLERGARRMTRLAPIAGEWIDRSRRIDFELEGKTYRGFAGDSIASALWAADVRVLGRSFKYHRPRGVLSLANHDVNALLDDGRSLNLRADVTPLAAGMRLSPVNVFGTLAHDRAHLLDRFSRFLPVGF